MIKYGRKNFDNMLQLVRYREALDSKAQHLADMIHNQPYSKNVIQRKIKYVSAQKYLEDFDKWLEEQEI